jgi:arylsulfatase A-like enzyme
MREKRPMDDERLARARAQHLDRIRAAQAVNDMIRAIRTDLAERDLDDSTYLVVTSDNGFHLGEHGLRRGKNSMFDHDIRVPLIVSPPGGLDARTVSAVTQNTDLLPTFLDIAGAVPSGGDGRSLLPLLEDTAQAARWREGALVEFTSATPHGDPDRDRSQVPPTYRGVRTAGYIYVDYSADPRGRPTRADAELYDLARDPGATVNRYRQLSGAERRALDQAVERYASCAGESCWTSGRNMPEITTERR